MIALKNPTECHAGGLADNQPSRRATPFMAALLAGGALLSPAFAGHAYAQTAPGAAAAADEGIIVTARKRGESLAKVPISITALTGETLKNHNIQSFADYATKVPNLSFSFGSGPTGVADARTVAIRGITGQNLSGTSGATGFYIDDTPVPGSLDPRVLDLDTIEVLKGPQGTLYGESSLGGNVRLITKRPNLFANELTVTADAGLTSHGGSPDGGVSAVANVVVVPERLALRGVAFYDHDAGYLSRTFPTDPASPATGNPFLTVPRTRVGDQGAETSYGGSLTALFRATDHFDIRLRVMAQEQKDHGFPATFAPLPGFTPTYTLDRAFDVQPRALDRWVLPSIDLTYHGHGWTFTSSTSYFHRYTQDIEDSTYGTQQVLAGFYGVSGLPSQPYLWYGQHSHSEITTETRFSFEPIHNLSGTLGVFYSHTKTDFNIPSIFATGLVQATLTNTVVGPWPNDMLWTQDNPGTQDDFSLFGELYYKFLDKFTLTLGGRGYWLKQTSDFTADGFQNFGPTLSDPQHNKQSGFSPKVGLAYQASDETMFYASASKGFRAGGSQPFAPFCSSPTLPVSAITNLRSDTLWTYEGGAKVQMRNPGILISGAGFHIDWSNIQQQVALPCGSYFDINGDKASINGGEVEVSGRVSHGLQVNLGVGYESTTITHPGALSLVGVAPGSRILGTPAWTVTLGGVYTKPIAPDIDGFVSADYSYTGDSVALLNGGGGAESTRPAYSLVNLRVGVNWKRSELSINATNLTNAKPNLGDIGYVGYAQFDIAGTIIPQVATLRPATVTLQFRQKF